MGRDRLGLLAEISESLLPVDINQPEVCSSYVDLYLIARLAGQNKDEKNQNDLWIASCAIANHRQPSPTIANRATLITTDKDFDVFPEQALSRCWIDPSAFPESR